MDNMNSVEDICSEYVVMKNKPTIIVTSSGTKYVRIMEPAQSRKIDKTKTSNASKITSVQSVGASTKALNPNLIRRQEQKEEEEEEEEEVDDDQTGSVDTDQLESLSLSLEQVDDVGTSNAINDKNQNTKSSSIASRRRDFLNSLKQKSDSKSTKTLNSKRRAVKRKFGSISPDETPSTELTEQEPVTEDLSAKRRRVLGQKRKYQKKDIVWATYNGELEPVIVISCGYEGNEKWYPSQYEVIWLRWVDNTNENGRMGQCSVSMVPSEKVISKMMDNDFARITNQFADAAKVEIKRWRPDVYKSFYTMADRRRSTKPNKVRRRRRMSII